MSRDIKEMKRPIEHSEAGFTIVELILSLGIFAIAIAALMGTVASSFALVEISSDRAQGVKEAHSVLIDIKLSASQAALFPDDVVAAFPAGALVPARTVLPGEVVNISYVDPAATPLLATVSVQWTNAQGRVLTESVGTVLSGL